ncbi:MAG: 3-hydroxyacyl-CoA dehydrogenase NAD-binding domain-containing protein [Gemmatimonadota bacterium]
MITQVPDLQLAVQDGLATLTFDRPDSKVNLLASPVMFRLDEMLATVEAGIADGEIRALLIRSAKPGNFIAGADIDELAQLDDATDATRMSRRGQEVFLRLEQLPVPTLAAINGTCVGGGLELALACDFRLAADHPATRLGLPETRLGICPGLGGTVRLPRLVGLQAALDLILSGRQVSAARAGRMGLVDRVVDAERFDHEVAGIAGDLARGESPLRPRRRSALARLVKDGAPARWLIRRLASKDVLRRTQGYYPALPEALDVTVRGLGLAPDRAHELEAEAFGRLAVTPESKNLIFVFKLAEGARRQAPGGEAAQVRQAAVVGAGLMGSGIAELFAYQTIPVQVVDIDEARVRSGVERARALLGKAAKRAEWSDEDLEVRSNCLQSATGYGNFERTDLVVEAVLERMDVKQDVFRRIEERAPPTAVLTTNTSALSISELQESLSRPERVCGLHFFNPPHLMPLVEVVRGARTDDNTLATAFKLAVRLGKTPVVVKDSPGFVVNRILAVYLTEAGHLLQAGMTVQSIDRVMSRFGMPMGPLRLLDEVGLDIVAEVSGTMTSAFGERFAHAPVVAEVLATGVTGRKNGRGFYIYDGSKVKGVNKEIERLLRAASAGSPPQPGEAEQRMVFGMINEAARTLDDRVVGSAETLDVAMIMGAGFPPFRGGLLRYADSLGLGHIADRLRYYAANVDARFNPAPGLLERNAFYAS